MVKFTYETITIVTAVKRPQNVPVGQDKKKCLTFCHHCVVQLIFIFITATTSSLASILPLYTA